MSGCSECNRRPRKWWLLGLVAFGLAVLAAELMACNNEQETPPEPTVQPATTTPPRPAQATVLKSVPVPPPDPTDPPETLDGPDPEEAVWQLARRVLDKHCVDCHSRGGPKASSRTLDHFSFDEYPPGGHHADEMGKAIRRALGADSKGGRPMKPHDELTLRPEERDLLLAWSRAFDAAQPPKGASKSHRREHKSGSGHGH